MGTRGVAAAGRAALRLWDALQPQRQAGFQGLAVVFKLICRMAGRPKVPD